MSAARILTSRIVNAHNDGAVADIVKQHVGEFNEIHVSTALSKLAKLMARSGTRTLGKNHCDSVLLLLDERLRGFNMIRARQIANLLWSYAKLGYHGNHSIVRHLSDQVPTVTVDDFKPHL